MSDIVNIALIGAGAGRTTLCKNLGATLMGENERGTHHALRVTGPGCSYRIALFSVIGDVDPADYDLAVLLCDVSNDNRAELDKIAENWINAGKMVIFVANKSDLLVKGNPLRRPEMKLFNPQKWLDGWRARNYPAYMASSMSRIGQCDRFLRIALAEVYGYDGEINY